MDPLLPDELKFNPLENAGITGRIQLAFPPRYVKFWSNNWRRSPDEPAVRQGKQLRVSRDAGGLLAVPRSPRRYRAVVKRSGSRARPILQPENFTGFPFWTKSNRTPARSTLLCPMISHPIPITFQSRPRRDTPPSRSLSPCRGGSARPSPRCNTLPPPLSPSHRSRRRHGPTRKHR